MRGSVAVRSAVVVLGVLAHLAARAQQLEPRAYSPSPVGANFSGIIYANSSGDVVFDPALPFTDVSAHVNSAAAFYARTFGLFGRSASITAVVPYAWGTVQGNVGETFRRAERSGLADVGVRLAVNILGGPAVSPKEFASRKPGRTLGASLIVSAPTGQYDGTKLINIGTNRWAFKPELGYSHPVGKWWLEAYGGAWFFTTNNDFFGGQTRKQDPLTVLQAHVIYNFRPRLWLAMDATWYGGGSTTVNGVANADRQDNTRAGLTLAVPIPHRQSLKFAYARGTSSRVGSKLSTLSVAWQILWFDHAPKTSQGAS